MILEHGNIWTITEKTDVLIFTANSTVTKDGRLVMGRGMAKEVKDNFPGIDTHFGSIITSTKGARYGLMLIKLSPLKLWLVAFQVKYLYKEGAKLELIEYSTSKLMDFVRINKSIRRVDMNFPGIGYGNLSRDEVLPIISILPDNVHVWERL